MRPVQKTQHNNQPVHHKGFDEFSRVNEHVLKTGRNCLPESFNMEMYKFPVWREEKKKKWMSQKGFDNHTGCDSAHVKVTSPGSLRTESHANSINSKSVWV